MNADGRHHSVALRVNYAEVNKGKRVAVSIGNVGVLVVSGAVIGELPLVEIPPNHGDGNGREDYDEKELSQVSGAIEASVDTDESAFGRAGIAGTVLPTT